MKITAKKTLFHFSTTAAILSASLALTSLNSLAKDENKVTPTKTTEIKTVPLNLFEIPEGMEITRWASSPMLHNPTNIDIDKDGRIWVAEGRRYRHSMEKFPKGDRIVVLEDTNQDGKADSSHTFVQDPDLVAPLGVAVIDNQIVVSQPPNLIVYTDVNRDLKFDPAVDKKEILLTGFSGKNHDHSLHSVTAGPDGKWHFNAGNTGAKFTDQSGKTFRIAGPYNPKPVGPVEFPFKSSDVAGKRSDDGHIYVGGFAVRMNPDGTHAEITGHNFRNSYEQSINSFGDVFQNDNDDPPACRVSHVLEYGNAGFASADGKRSWQADRRPGQSIPTAEWRQEDPGTMPIGDVYGGGSPTGNVYYENGALGEKWRGTFLACEAGRNIVFAYQPIPNGAGFKLEQQRFVTSNPEEKWAGSDFLGGEKRKGNADIRTLFRPSDVAVGPDGAIYISDWIDPRVGGHQALDTTQSGAIYRIAPIGFKPQVPQLDLTTTAGLILALQSPAINVRNLGFVGLKKQGESALPAVQALLKNENPYIQGRAIFLMPHLGAKGVQATTELAKGGNDAITRVTAFRALRRADQPLPDLSADPSPAVRREVALSCRNLSLYDSRDALVNIAKKFDGDDRTYLEAFGIGSTSKESGIYDAVQASIGDENPLKWSKAFARIAWRLHPNQAIKNLLTRALSDSLPTADRKLAMTAIAFNDSSAAAQAMLEIAAQEKSPLKSTATWWLLNRSGNLWTHHGLMPKLKSRGIYDPDSITLQEIIIPDPKGTPKKLPAVAEILKLDGNASKGKITAQRCIMCHQIDGIGIEYGPTLTGFGKTQTSEVLVDAIVNPSSGISHGYEGTEIQSKDGKLIHGLLIKKSNPFIMQSMGGVTQIVPGKKIKSRKDLGRSLMLSADQLGLTAQDVADIVAYLKTI
ncbi:MAG: c-type cytochrome [Verrucomicrobiales bacterium]|nr:c-type cytochrome [Verrucomicrobiales bacterium]